MATWSDLKIKLIGTGDETGTWGETTNANFNNAVEQAITGSATITFADANYVLTLIDSTDLQDARALRLFLSGVASTTRELTVPAIQKFYIIDNDLTQNITVKNPTGAETFTVPAGTTALVFSKGAGVVSAISYFAGALTSFLAVITGGTIDDTPVGSSTPNTGAFTTLEASSATLTTPLPVTSGGTGVGTSTGTGDVVLSDSPTITSPDISDANLTGIPVAPTATALTNTTQVATTAFVTGAIADKNLGTMSTQNANAIAVTGGTMSGVAITGGTVASLTSPLPVLSGGTGVTTSTGSGAVVLGTSPTIATPTISTPVINSATFNPTGSAPLFAPRAWIRFDSNTTIDVAYTYTQTGFTVTVTTASAHNLITGNAAYLNMNSGNAVTGLYQVTVTGPTTFTTTQAASRTTSGVGVMQCVTYTSGSNVSTNIGRVATGQYIINFVTFMPNTNYILFGSAGANGDRTIGPYGIANMQLGYTGVDIRSTDGVRQAESYNGITVLV